MEDHTLKQLWLHSCESQQLDINPDQLLQSIDLSVAKMERLVRRRDRREIGAAVCMIPIFLYCMFIFVNPFAKTGAAIITAGCLLSIARILRAKKAIVREDASSAVIFYLQVSLKKVQNQVKLPDTVLWWYLLPLSTGVLCLFYSFSMPIAIKIIYTIVVVAMGGFIYFLNKRAVRKYLRPLEQSLTSALNKLSVPG